MCDAKKCIFFCLRIKSGASGATYSAPLEKDFSSNLIDSAHEKGDV